MQKQTCIQTFFLFRILKILGCKHGCHDATRGSMIPPAPSSSALMPNGVTIDTLRSRGIGLLSRLLWYDKKQFRQFLRLLVDSRDITFLMPFFHGYLAFCSDPTNPFFFAGSNQPSSGENNNFVSVVKCDTQRTLAVGCSIIVLLTSSLTG